MGLSSDLISQFVKATNDKTKEKSESTQYGTIVEYNGSKYIRLDGSDLLTPIKSTVSIKDGDRATVTIKNHTATVNGNLSDPAASSGTVTQIGSKVSEFEVIIADKVSTKVLEAEIARIDELTADNVVIKDTLTANRAEIDELIAEDVTINGILTANEAEIENLKTTKLDAKVAVITYATITDLEATNADIYNLEATYGDFKVLTTDKFSAMDATIDDLKANKLDAETAKITYAAITELDAVKADVAILDANYGEFGTLTAENIAAIEAHIEDLEANKLDAETAEITYATITELDAVKADVGVLDADLADINTLIFGSASGTSIHTSFANAVIAQLGNAQIKSAMIENVTADKIVSGDIITNNVRVLSEDGKLLISDETIQISDDTRVRVQIGKDAAGDYSISIWDADGKLMFSEGGITDSAIKEAIIRNDMVSDNANISARKLDIDSLFTVINEDGSHTIKSSRIYMSDEEQTLDVAFTEMSTTVNQNGAALSEAQSNLAKAQADLIAVTNRTDATEDEIAAAKLAVKEAQDAADAAQATANQNSSDISTLTQTVSTQGTQLSVVQGQISSKIWQQDITSAISGLEIGGKNLLRDSKGDFVLTAKNTGGEVDNWNYYRFDCDMELNETYTVSADIEVTAGEFTSVSVIPYTGGITATCVIPDNGRISYTFTKTVDTINCVLIYAGLAGSTRGQAITIRNVKIEKGNKATDWTPAPEDLEEDVTTLNTKYSSLDQTVNGISATVASHTTEISNKADQSTVTSVQSQVSELETSLNGFKTSVSETYSTKTELENAVDGINDTTSDLSSKYSSLEQTVDGISTTVSSHTTQISNKADNSTVTAIQGQVSTLEQSVEGFKTSVSETYATKTDLGTTNSNVTNLTDKHSSLEQTVNGISTTVSSHTDQISNKADKSTVTTVQNQVSELDQTVDGISAAVASHTTEISNKADQSEVTSVKNQVSELELSVDGFKTTVSETYVTKTEFNDLEIGGRNLAEKTYSDWKDTNVSQWTGGIGYYVNGLERWGKLTGFEELGLQNGDPYTISIELNAVSKSIKLRIDLYRGSTLGENYIGKYTETVVSGTNKKVSYTGVVTEEFPYFAIYVANHDTSDATTTTEQYRCLKIEKGNKATDWTPAPEDVDNTIDALTTRVVNNETAIEQNTTQIALRATTTQVETVASTANEALINANQAQADIDGLDIGGRNYYSSNSPLTQLTPSTSDGVEYQIWITRPHDDCPNGFQFTGGRGGTGSARISNVITSNGDWTVSFWIRGSQSTPVGIRLDICDSGYLDIVTTGDNTWKRIEHTVTVTNFSESVYNFVDFERIGWAYFFIKDFKVEKGNHATDWSPAPEDVQGEIDGLTTTVTRHESSITTNADGIAALSTRTAVNETAISELELTADGLTSRVTSSETNIQDIATLNLNAGKMLFTDPTFSSGYNSTALYNNSSNGNVTISRVEKSSDNPTTNSDYELVCTNIGSSTPGLGGFYWSHASRANAVFVYRIVAKIPTGYWLCFASNEVGGVFSGRWLTSNIGTGRFVEYVYRIQCGVSGNFNSTGFFYIDGSSYGTTDSPVKWYVAYATCFDMTGVSDTLQLYSETNTNRNDITDTNTRIDNAETLIQQLSDCISMLVTDENGESLMTQTSTGWTFSTSSINNTMSDLSNSISSLQSTTGSTEATVKSLQNAVNDLEETAEYVRITTYGDEPCIELGESDSNFKLMITNTRIMFMRGSSIPTYIDTTGLITENITINGELHHGSFVWKQRSNGNYGVQYVG